jgi:hypothetical protein
VALEICKAPWSICSISWYSDIASDKKLVQSIMQGGEKILIPNLIKVPGFIFLPFIIPGAFSNFYKG